jgi:hypothetical protein
MLALSHGAAPRLESLDIADFLLCDHPRCNQVVIEITVSCFAARRMLCIKRACGVPTRSFGGGLRMPTGYGKSRRWRQLADKARFVAEQMTDHDVQQIILGVALAYEHLAELGRQRELREITNKRHPKKTSGRKPN